MSPRNALAQDSRFAVVIALGIVLELALVEAIESVRVRPLQDPAALHDLMVRLQDEAQLRERRFGQAGDEHEMLRFRRVCGCEGEFTGLIVLRKVLVVVVVPVQ